MWDGSTVGRGFQRLTLLTLRCLSVFTLFTLPLGQFGLVKGFWISASEIGMVRSASCPLHREKRSGSAWPLSAQQRTSAAYYSITSLARTSNDGGTVRPSALAVFMLMTTSNLVGCSTGRSAGFAPLRILSK